MKKLLQEKKYSLNLSDFDQRKRYISKLASHLNNEVLGSELTPTDRSKIYNALIQTLKTMNEVCKDATLEALEARITALEATKAKP